MRGSRRWTRIVPWLWLAGALLFLCAFLNARIDLLLDADMSSELVLSKLLNAEGGILSRNWCYSTELRVLNTQLVFAPLFSIFHSWHAVRVTGTVLLYLILLASYGFFCREAGVWKIFPWSAPVLLLPLSENHLRIVLLGSYYIPHIAILFTVLGLALGIAKANSGRGRLLRYLTLAALSFAAGLEGLRLMLNLFLPLLGVAMLLPLWDRFALRAGADRRRRRLLVPAAVALGFALAGCAVNGGILNRVYRVRRYDSLGFKLRPDKLVRVPLDFLNALGLQKGMPLLLVGGLTSLLLAAAICRAVHRCALCRDSRALPPERRAVALFPLVSALALTAVFVLLDMRYQRRFNLPVVVTALPAVAIWIEGIPQRARRIAVRVALALCVSCTAALVYADQGAAVEPARELGVIAEAVLEDGYTQGYATFWNGNVMTELSDGAIEMRTWDGTATRRLDELYPWLQDRRHLETAPEGKVFLLFERDQLEEMPLAREIAARHGDRVIYESPSYRAYGFPSCADID